MSLRHAIFLSSNFSRTAYTTVFLFSMQVGTSIIAKTESTDLTVDTKFLETSNMKGTRYNLIWETEYI